MDRVLLEARLRGVSLGALVVTTTLLFWSVTTREAHLRTNVEAYETTADASHLFERDSASYRFSNVVAHDVPILRIDDDRRFQTIDGFGAELTGSSAHLIESLPDHGAALIGTLFDRGGLSLSFVRLTVGASDFSLGSYTYDDVAPGAADPKLAAFSVARDADVFTALAAIRAASSDVRFIASPWTAPAWMKTGDKLFGGGLRPDAYGAYANYLVAYVRALAAHDVPLAVLTPQNEPLLDSNAYPSMTLSATEEAAFVGTALGPALRAAYPATNIVVNDHNWDGGDYALTVLADARASKYVTGSAFHCYGGNVSAMSRVHDAHPDRSIYLTECSGGDWSTNFGSNLAWDTRNLIIGATVNWARAVVLGNLALDAADGPTNGGCADCRGVVTVGGNGTITRNVEYYVLEHAARFVRPGAVRISSSCSLGSELPNVAFLNTDGSKVLIALNDSTHRATFAVRYRSGSFRFSLPRGAVVTFHWS